MKQYGKIYSYIYAIVFISAFVLVNFKVLYVVTAIIVALMLSFLEASILVDHENAWGKHFKIAIVMMTINIFIAYRCVLIKEYNVKVEYIISTLVIFTSLITISIREYKKKKKSGKEQSKVKKIFSSFAITIVLLEGILPIVIKEFSHKEINLKDIHVYGVGRDTFNGSYNNNDMNKRFNLEVENEIKKIGSLKRCTSIEQINTIKESVLEEKEKYKIYCAIKGEEHGDLEEITFLKTGTAYVKIKNEGILSGKSDFKYDYYVINLLDDIKKEIHSKFQ